MASSSQKVYLFGSGLGTTTVSAALDLTADKADAKTYREQIVGFRQPLTARDVVVYGVVGHTDIEQLLDKDLRIVDNCIRYVIETHLENVKLLYKRGCRKLVVIYCDGKHMSPDFDDFLKKVILEERGLLSQLKKLTLGPDLSSPLQIYQLRESLLRQGGTGEILSQVLETL